MLVPDLTEVMLRRIEENAKQRVQEECREIVQRSEHLKSYLTNIARIGKWSIPLTIRGMETHHPEHEKNLDLLERCGLVASRIRYTEHNTYREYLLTEEGVEPIQKEGTL